MPPQGGAVDVQETPQQGGEFLLPCVGEGAFHHARRTVAHRATHHIEVHGRETLLGTQRIQRRKHVGRRVEHGAVHIEQDRTQGQRDPVAATLNTQTGSLVKCAR